MIISTNLRAELPEGCYGLLPPRSESIKDFVDVEGELS